MLAEGLREQTGEKETSFMALFSYLLAQPEYRDQVKELVNAAVLGGQDGEIGRAAAGALYGNILQGSVTRLEQYAACAYAHFLKYGPGADETAGV